MNKAVIPAAGTGSRLSPITDYLPKAMLPLGKKPVLHHIVEELHEASIEKIAIIARSNQTAIFKYFKNSPGIKFIIDDSQSGPGGAIFKAREFVDGDDFIAVFADSPIKGSGRGKYLKELVKIKNSKKAVAVLAIYEIPKSEIGSRGIVIVDRPSNEKGPKLLRNIIEKPSSEEVDSTWGVACRYVVSADIFQELGDLKSEVNGELQLTTGIRKLISKEASVYGYPLKEELKRYDTGNFKGYWEASKDFFDESLNQKSR